MKAQPVLLMVFFAGVVGMVAWSYYAVTRPAVQEQQSKQHERESLTADLQRCCHRKQSQSAQYEQYAHTASVEDAPSAATLFRALAHSERVQEFYCAELIGKLGSSYQSPSRILIFQGSTPTNIARSLARLSHSSDNEQTIHYHLTQGNRLVARLLIWVEAAEGRQRELLAAYTSEQPDTTGAGYLVCPTCGNIYRSDHYDRYCPHCLTSARQFTRFTVSKE